MVSSYIRISYIEELKSVLTATMVIILFKFTNVYIRIYIYNSGRRKNGTRARPTACVAAAGGAGGGAGGSRRCFNVDCR